MFFGVIRLQQDKKKNDKYPIATKEWNDLDCGNQERKCNFR